MTDHAPGLLAEPYEVQLGDDSDCETCGRSWNRAELDPDWDGAGAGKWMFQVSYGCFGGASASSTDEDWRAQLAEALEACRRFPGWTEHDEMIVVGHIAAVTGEAL